MSIKNPITGRNILIGGLTWTRLRKRGLIGGAQEHSNVIIEDDHVKKYLDPSNHIEVDLMVRLSLKTPYVVKIHEIQPTYFIMERFGTQTFYDVIMTNNSIDIVRHILHQCFDVLKIMEKEKIIHNDFHCGNILVDEKYHIKVIDFELGCYNDPIQHRWVGNPLNNNQTLEHYQKVGRLVGRYQIPEQLIPLCDAMTIVYKALTALLNKEIDPQFAINHDDRYTPFLEYIDIDRPIVLSKGRRGVIFDPNYHPITYDGSDIDLLHHVIDDIKYPSRQTLW